MDIQLLIKIVHMTLASLLIVVVLARTLTLFVGVQAEQPNPIARKLLVALQHFAVTFIAITGLIALYLKDFVVQPWFYAKVVLFLVMLSALQSQIGRASCRYDFSDLSVSLLDWFSDH